MTTSSVQSHTVGNVTPRRKPRALSVGPLATSPATGASLAFLGVRSAIPLMHGSQGCTAFSKVVLVRHFREPIPLQTTAMDQVSTVMGAQDNITAALATMASRTAPELIGLVSTGLSETQGCDLGLGVREFRKTHPEHDGVAVVPVTTPDYVGCLETGWASTVLAMVEALVPDGDQPSSSVGAPIVNVLPGSLMTPGDVEALEELVGSFGLDVRIVPDLGASLSGTLPDVDFSPITTSGVSVAAIRDLGRARLTVAVGASMGAAARRLEEKTGVPALVVPHLHTLEATDQLVARLLALSGLDEPPPRVQRQRSQLLDALLDTHFFLGGKPLAIAGDPDLVAALHALTGSVGMECVSAVVARRGPALGSAPLQDSALVGDFADVEASARSQRAELLLASSHGSETADRLAIPHLAVGIPNFDELGAPSLRWVGYQGVRDALFRLANSTAPASRQHAAYHSRLRPPAPAAAPSPKTDNS